ncbi:MAG: hypothetical protein A2Y39_00810 [Candidatus Delongbacteria bacterium GWF2_40_14]|nr:MAG: hypothetical protein A2Y39_00810 [Candidatus Delongbacteria bacterium GWF2_40_14]
MKKTVVISLIKEKVSEYYDRYIDIFDRRTIEVFQTKQSVIDFMLDRANKESSYRHEDKDGKVLTVSGSSARGLYQIKKPAESDVIRLSEIDGISALNIDENIFIAFYYIFIVIPEFFNDYYKEFNKSNFTVAYTRGWKYCTDIQTSETEPANAGPVSEVSKRSAVVKILAIILFVTVVVGMVSYTWRKLK